MKKAATTTSATAPRADLARPNFSSKPKPGTRPGLEHIAGIDTPPPPGQVRVRCIEYGPDQAQRTEASDLDGFLSAPRPPWTTVRWINVDGLHPYVVRRFMETYGFHTLSAEDVLNVPQRAAME